MTAGAAGAIGGATRVAAVIGWPVAHSRSPHLLNAAFAAAGVDAVMIPIGVPPDGLAAVLGGLAAMRALGASVTVPHKLAAAAACAELSPAARAIGAVNCLHVDGGLLVGHNTDCDGFADGLAAACFGGGGGALLLGAGGAARAVAYGLGARGLAAGVDVIARDPARVAWTRAAAWTAAALRDAFAGADLVVDCTSAALGSDDAGERAFVDALPLEALRPGAWVSTLVYHRPTRLLERAGARGHATLDGRAMLVHQGARAFTLWTGRPAPIDAMTHALARSLAGT